MEGVEQAGPQVAALGLREKLGFWAQCMAARFGGPVYLVGSALTKENPRDVDIRIVIPDHDFFNRYDRLASDFYTDRGPIWVEDVAKLGRDLLRTWHGLNLDLQVYPESAWRDQPQHRLTLAAPREETRYVPPLCDDPEFWIATAPQPDAQEVAA